MFRHPSLFLAVALLFTRSLAAQHGLAAVFRHEPAAVGVFSTETNKPAGFLVPGNAQLGGVAVSPDGARLYVLLVGTGKIAVIDIATSAVIAQIDAGRTEQGLFGLNPDGTRLYFIAPVQGGLSVRTIDTGTNQIIQTVTVAIQEFPSSLSGFIFSADGSKLLIPSSGTATMAVLSADNGSYLKSVPIPTPASGITSNADRTSFAIANTGNAGTTVSLVSAETLQVVKQVQVPGTACSGSVAMDGNAAHAYVIVSRHCNALVSADETEGTSIVSVNFVAGLVNASVPTLNPAITLSLAPGSTTLYVGETGTVAALQTPSLAAITTIAEPGLVNAIAQSSSTMPAYVSNYSSSALIYADPLTGEPQTTLPVGYLSVGSAISTSTDGAVSFIPVTSSANVAIFDNVTRKPITYLPLTSRPTSLAAASGKGPLFVFSAGYNEIPSTLAGIDIHTGEVLTSIPISAGFSNLAISPDGSQVWLATAPGFSVYDSATLKLLASFAQPIFEDGPFPFAFSKDGMHCYVNGPEGTDILDISTQTLQINRMLPEPFTAYSLAVSPDGQTLYGLAGALETIDLTSGAALVNGSLGYSLRGLAVSSNGAELYIGGEDGQGVNTLFVYNTGTQQVTSEVEYPGPITNVSSTPF